MNRKKGVILSYILMLIEMLSSILFTPFLIRSFGQAEYGIYSLVATITAYLALLDLGIGNSIVRYMAKFRALEQKDNQRSLLAVTILFYAAVSLIVIVIGFVINKNFGIFFSNGLSEGEIALAKKMLFITVLNMAATLVFAPFNNTIIAFERFVFSKLSVIVKTIVRVLISVAVLFMGGRGVAIVTVNFCMTLVFGIISTAYVAFKIKLVPTVKNLNIGFIREIIGYSAFVFIQMIATQINSMVDQILIGAFVQSAAVVLGIYAVGAQINQYFQSIGANVTGVLMPGIVALVEKKADSNALMNEMIRIGRIILIMLSVIWCVFIVVGDLFIVLWAGEVNLQAYAVACLLITPAMLVITQSVGSQILWAKNKHKVQAYLKIITSVVNIFITLILIKWNPLIGACIGTAIAVIFSDIIVMNIVFSRDIGISMKEYYKGLFKGILPCVFAVLIIGMVLKGVVNLPIIFELVLVGAVMLICYIILMYFKGMNKYEKDMVETLFLKIFKRKNIRK